jgi:hypothetical protein
MPMIDIYAATGTFVDPHRLAVDAAATVMSVEQVPDSAWFRYLVVQASGEPSLRERTWVLLTEAPDGGWGLAGHANTNAELVTAARAQIAELQARARQG